LKNNKSDVAKSLETSLNAAVDEIVLIPTLPIFDDNQIQILNLRNKLFGETDVNKKAQLTSIMTDIVDGISNNVNTAIGKNKR